MPAMSDPAASSPAVRPVVSVLPAWQRGAQRRLGQAFAVAAVVHALLIAAGVRPWFRPAQYELPDARSIHLPPPLLVLPPVMRGPDGGGAGLTQPGPAPLGSAPENAPVVPVPTPAPQVAAPQPGVANGVPGGQGGAGTGGGTGGGSGGGTGSGELRQELEPARLLTFTWPHYPEAARKKKITGDVVLSVHVTELGLVDSVRIVRALALDELNDEAMQVARRQRYEPARLGPRAVASWQTYTVTFAKP